MNRDPSAGEKVLKSQAIHACKSSSLCKCKTFALKKQNSEFLAEFALAHLRRLQDLIRDD
jgi:hypothetical protein